MRPVPIRRAIGAAARAAGHATQGAEAQGEAESARRTGPRVRLAKTSTTALTMKVKAFTQVTQRRAGAR